MLGAGDYIGPVDFLRYAEAAARLVNTDPRDARELRAYLAGREWLQEQCTQRDATTLHRFADQLHDVFRAGAADDERGVVDRLNTLMEAHPITPRISDHDGELHLHVATKAASVADLLIGEALLGLATLACDLDPNRLGVCAAERCEEVFVDTSPNRSRRYCSDRCSSRANVAAYRARQRAAAG